MLKKVHDVFIVHSPGLQTRWFDELVWPLCAHYPLSTVSSTSFHYGVNDHLNNKFHGFSTYCKERLLGMMCSKQRRSNISHWIINKGFCTRGHSNTENSKTQRETSLLGRGNSGETESEQLQLSISIHDHTFLCTMSSRSNACLSVVGGHVNVLHERDSNLNISPKMSYDVFECDIVTLQNYMLMIL